MRQRGLRRESGLGHGLFQLLLDEGIPALVVVGTRGVGDAPVGHCAIAVVFDRLAKTADGFIVVVAVAPGQSTIEPELGLGRTGRHRAAVGAQIVIVVHRFILPTSA
ncbi:hypothetical protein D3C85_1084440 [compost metagenome]